MKEVTLFNWLISFKAENTFLEFDSKMVGNENDAKILEQALQNVDEMAKKLDQPDNEIKKSIKTKMDEIKVKNTVVEKVNSERIVKDNEIERN